MAKQVNQYQIAVAIVASTGERYPVVNLNLFIVDPHRVRKPDVAADPVYFLHVLNGAMTKHLHTELFFVFGFGKMCMQMNAILARALAKPVRRAQLLIAVSELIGPAN